MARRQWYSASAAGGGAEDLSLTPEERASREREAARLDEEYEAFMSSAEKSSVGGDASKPEMVVLGAGLVGSLCAVVLASKGFKVTVYERYPDIRSIPKLGRSINLAVTSRGLRAIKSLGGPLYDQVLGIARRITGRIIHTPEGKTIFQRYGKDDSEYNYAISRYELNKLLLESAAEHGAVLHFDHMLSETSDFGGEEAVGCTLHFTCPSPSDPSAKIRRQVKVACPVVACDGAGSRARYAMRHAGLTSFTEDLLTQGYKEVLFPKPADGIDFGATSTDGGEACSHDRGLHIWPRGDHMLMALPNLDGSFTGTFYTEMRGGENAFEALRDKAACGRFCEKFYAQAIPLVGGPDEMVRQVAENPEGLLGTVQCERWAARARVVLIGDASHAMVPFFGQGCNCGFEDVAWLSKLLDRHCGTGGGGTATRESCTPANFEACFAALEAERRPNALAICQMALENFVEMRHKTGDCKFRAMKKVENRLENAFGDRFRSRYSMVCYGGEGNVSYANAQTLGILQQTILEELCKGMAPERLQDEEGTKAEVDKIDMSQASDLIDKITRPKLAELQVDLSTVLTLP